MECLHNLSRQGRKSIVKKIDRIRFIMKMIFLLGTIIFSIHQPRFSIFKLFDSLFLVAAGRCVYHGPAREVLPFFSSAGFNCEEHDNPADFLLDISQGDRLPALRNSSNDNTSSEAIKPVEIYLNESYLNSIIYANIQNEIATEVNRPREALGEFQLPTKSYLNEIFYVSQRTIRNAFRNPLLTVMQSSMSIVLALLIGLIYYQIRPDLENGVANRRGAIFFIVTNQVFSNLSALELFIKERVLFTHENVSGYYRSITYFLSKILCDILPLRTIPVICFSVISYFMMDFQQSYDKFFIFFFGVWLTSICAASLCFFVSACVRNFGTDSYLFS
jgi:ATP-binding cassette subfamily G (WHITE) protein 2